MEKTQQRILRLLVSSDQVITRIRDYVRELKQAKKNGQGHTSADGNGSVGSELLTHNGNNGNGKPSANGNGSLGFTSLPNQRKRKIRHRTNHPHPAEGR
jgi:hypothetical protein